MRLYPPQTIISLPVHTAKFDASILYRGKGAFAVLVGVQLSVPALYLPPVLNSTPGQQKTPPETIISLPVHTYARESRGEGALLVLVADQLSAVGLYLPPVLQSLNVESVPPQTIISLPVHTAAWPTRPSTPFGTLVAVQLSALGLYLPPVFK